MFMALSAVEGEELATYGPLVHNDQALRFLSLRGVREFPEDPDSAGESFPAGSVLIRAHGVPPECRRRLLASGRKVIDATCPHVANNQRLAREAAAAGMAVIIAADPSHPETLAVAGEAGTNCRLVSSLAEVDELGEDTAAGGILFLAQTTFNAKLFGEMSEAMSRRFKDCRIVDSICLATHNRQEEAERLAAAADILVVVGSRRSANTRRLLEAGKASGKTAILVETASDLQAGDFAGHSVAAVIAGASTPGWITQEVASRLYRLGRPGLGDSLSRLAHFLSESRISTALAAAGLAAAAQQLAETGMVPSLILAGAGYVFFAHVLNRRLPDNPEAARLSPIDSFYQARRRRMLGIAWLSAGSGAALAARSGPAIFSLFLAASLAAVLYALPAPPAPRRIARIRGIFSPRYWAMPIGWALILAAPPAWKSGSLFPGLAAMLMVFFIRLGGALVRDLHDIASDRLLGIDTLSSRLGPGSAGRLASACFAAAALIPATSAIQAAVRGTFAPAWLISVALISLAPGLGQILLERVKNRRLLDASLLQAEVDGMCLLAGLPALAAGIRC
jgi:4-hydroxy-3-methylbut-2-enyl diphosphate reductase